MPLYFSLFSQKNIGKKNILGYIQETGLEDIKYSQRKSFNQLLKVFLPGGMKDILSNTIGVKWVSESFTYSSSFTFSLFWGYSKNPKIFPQTSGFLQGRDWKTSYENTPRVQLRASLEWRKAGKVQGSREVIFQGLRI